MRLIDAEKYRKEFLDSRDFEPMKILDFQPTINAIPLEKLKEILDGYDGSIPSMITCFSKIQKLVESEDK